MVTSHGTEWERVKERLEGTSPGLGQLADAVGRLLTNDAGGQNLLNMTEGASLIGWDSEEARLHANARLTEDTASGAQQQLERIGSRMAGQWGATAAQRTTNGGYALRHGLWNGAMIEVTVKADAVTINAPGGDTRTETAREDAVTIMGWDANGAQLIANWIGGTAGAWAAGVGGCTAVRRDRPGVTMHEAEISWGD